MYVRIYMCSFLARPNSLGFTITQLWILWGRADDAYSVKERRKNKIIYARAYISSPTCSSICIYIYRYMPDASINELVIERRNTAVTLYSTVYLGIFSGTRYYLWIRVSERVKFFKIPYKYRKEFPFYSRSVYSRSFVNECKTSYLHK